MLREDLFDFGDDLAFAGMMLVALFVGDALVRNGSRQALPVLLDFVRVGGIDERLEQTRSGQTCYGTKRSAGMDGPRFRGRIRTLQLIRERKGRPIERHTRQHNAQLTASRKCGCLTQRT